MAVAEEEGLRMRYVSAVFKEEAVQGTEDTKIGF